jgi:hypothetical protein
LNRRIGMGGAVALGLSVFLTAPAAYAKETATSPVAPATIYVPSGFDASMSDTGATGHLGVQGTGLHIYTEGATTTDKVARYVDTHEALAEVGEPKLDFSNTSDGGVPGFQLVVDFNADGTNDGILIGEPTVPGYGNDWWLNNAAAAEWKNAAPSHTGGYGSTNHGTLDQWRKAFPNAMVTAFGFSLGSGVKGDGMLNAIDFAGTSYAFAKDVVLNSKTACKDGGWAMSTDPVFKNQGQCVSHFATSTNNGNSGSGTTPSTAATIGTNPITSVNPSTATAANAGASRGLGGRMKMI